MCDKHPDLSKGQIIFYTDDDGKNNVEIVQQGDSVWLSADQIASLFGKDRSNIQRHIKHIFSDGELDQEATCAFFAQVQTEGNRQVKRKIPYYNLDIILAVGYRVSSKIATDFRKWATGILHQYLLDGYALNEKKLIQKQEQITALQNSLNLFTRAVLSQTQNVENAQNLAKVLKNFADGLDVGRFRPQNPSCQRKNGTSGGKNRKTRVSGRYRKHAIPICFGCFCQSQRRQLRQFNQPDLPNVRWTGLLPDFGRKSRDAALFFGKKPQLYGRQQTYRRGVLFVFSG